MNLIFEIENLYNCSTMGRQVACFFRKRLTCSASVLKVETYYVVLLTSQQAVCVTVKTIASVFLLILLVTHISRILLNLILSYLRVLYCALSTVNLSKCNDQRASGGSLLTQHPRVMNATTWDQQQKSKNQNAFQICEPCNQNHKQSIIYWTG